MEQSAVAAQARVAEGATREDLLVRIAELQAEVAEHLERIAVLEQRTQHDTLTGLLSRDAFFDLVRAEWHRHANGRQEMGLMFIDLDNFKAINDTFDHRVGDSALAALGAQMIRSFRRAGEIGGRIGGDEFAVVLPNVNLTHAAELTERLRGAIAAMDLPVGAEKLNITTSIGVTTAWPHLEKGGYTEALARADAAVKSAKTNGKNRVVAAQLRENEVELYIVKPAEEPASAQAKLPPTRRR